ncbi:MAG TPA: dTDP-4-amino-4,6-dideoxygalactose transaminase [Balneola sp.]|jgi:dTDP-4-amino-4,6-dideoxygalactose transaminase|nr:dTDP-4-amino-4,6-dideoxygalactose transaminase [Balneola sp.]MAO78660.1 dTDP-4-amino-4,6-dideoxygalactose transaminase [Balneola sp.]MBF63112.1 dTDP-4-amino-4,6-dideoxygalactose transaminase [Balneola sp.]HAW79864.1 dTDP-4-amino-4,6-dideoxygalactose transaminase [Balneola sp.]HBZ37433.1 dTDP-4-amino-4,6-dideoxygalactose transaminase [Balneola sp.]|tara:strand:+ start:27736 stop:28866 length:1131 start_codon:yes stop_codon:yes gene_type:complete
MIPFNKQNLFGNELEYIKEAYAANKVSGDGKFTKWCNDFIESKFETKKALLTTSGTHALEMAMLLIDLKEGDEVILPSYTFVSTANAIILRGAVPVFVDIRKDTLNIDESLIEAAVTDRTKAIFPVHYAGVSCEMDEISRIAKKHDLFVIEDAAQGVNAKYRNSYLGTLGDIGCYSFHETKNYSMGEGGAILINNERFIDRAEIIREKGTNRSKFFRGEIDKYTWVDVGSSFLPSEINAAVLKAQFENLDVIQNRRNEIYRRYNEGLKDLERSGSIALPNVPENCTSNAHMFYVITKDLEERTSLIKYLRNTGVYSVFHYVPLHMSEYYHKNFVKLNLPLTETLSSQLIRLPMFYSLENEAVDHIIESVINFYTNN